MRPEYWQPDKFPGNLSGALGQPVRRALRSAPSHDGHGRDEGLAIPVLRPFRIRVNVGTSVHTSTYIRTEDVCVYVYEKRERERERERESECVCVCRYVYVYVCRKQQMYLQIFVCLYSVRICFC